MLNYISAELYKLRQRKLLWLGVLLLLGLETLIFLPAWGEEGRILQAVYLELFLMAMPVGVMIAPVFAAAAYDDQWGRGTLKNEIVYGIPRSRIYLGKLFSGAAAGTVCALAAALWYLLLTAAVGEPSPNGDRDWLCLWVALWCNWCVWMAAYAVNFFLLFALGNTVSALVTGYTLTTVVGFISAVVAVSGAAEWQRVLGRLFYTYPIIETIARWEGTLAFVVNGRELTVPSADWPAAWALLVAALWGGGATGAGVLLLGRREIK